MSAAGSRRQTPDGRRRVELAPTPSTPWVPGLLLDHRYRLTARLGGGGVGEVWSAINLKTGRALALKRLSIGPGVSADARARFQLEARAACAVPHPNIVQVIDLIDAEGAVPYIVMELLQGETLADALQRTPRLDARQTAQLLLPVAAALSAAHARGIVHRDLKPSNIFLCRTDSELPFVKVLDFGLAKWMSGTFADNVKTRTGHVLGTPCYMAPEQATAPRAVDHRADIWALGVVLYESLSGVRPVDAHNAAGLVFALRSSGITPIERRAPELSRPLARHIAQLLSVNPTERPHDLRETLELLAQSAKLAPAPANRPATQRRLWVLALGLVALMALASTRLISTAAERPGAHPAPGARTLQRAQTEPLPAAGVIDDFSDGNLTPHDRLFAHWYHFAYPDVVDIGLAVDSAGGDKSLRLDFRAESLAPGSADAVGAGVGSMLDHQRLDISSHSGVMFSYRLQASNTADLLQGKAQGCGPPTQVLVSVSCEAKYSAMFGIHVPLGSGWRKLAVYFSDLVALGVTAPQPTLRECLVAADRLQMGVSAAGARCASGTLWIDDVRFMP